MTKEIFTKFNPKEKSMIENICGVDILLVTVNLFEAVGLEPSEAHTQTEKFVSELDPVFKQVANESDVLSAATERLNDYLAWVKQ